MADKKISQLNPASTFTGVEKFELLQGGLNLAATPEQMKTFVGAGPTREFSRAFSSTLVFDKNEIFYAPHVATGDVTYTIGAGGLTDQASGARQIITFNGSQSINFGSGFEFLYGVTNGQILDAGTYEIYFIYTNGSVSVNVPGVTAESSSITTLSAPANFAAVVGTDPETEIDLSWDDVANESSYEIQYSDTGGAGPWQALTNPAAGSTTYTHSGLTVGTTYHYRIRAVGDGVNFSTSAFSVAATTTESSGDVTAPTFTFSPVNGVTTWTINRPITLTANEAIRNTDGSEITNANVATRLTLKETNSGGADIPFSATIDVTKTIITITPTTHYGENQLVYVAVNNVEDVNGNEVTVAISSTFTTTDYTFFDGSTNRIQFGDILDSVFAANDTNFWLETTLNDAVLSGSHQLFTKYSTSDNQRSFLWYYINNDVYFAWFRLGTSINGLRTIKWAGALSAGEHTLVLKYDGSIDTNDGLDRLILEVDTVVAGSKTLHETTVHDISTMSIFNGTAQLSYGVSVNSGGTPGIAFYAWEAKDIIIRSAGGTVVELNVPNLVTGLDTSGNARNGTWV